jgi:dCTP deaminase
VPVHLKRGQPIFLIWYASLDRETTLKKVGAVRLGIDPELITGVAGELQSFASLSTKIKDVDKTLGDRIHTIEKEQTYYRVIGTVALALMIALTVSWVKDVFPPKPPAPPAVIAPRPASAP